MLLTEQGFRHCDDYILDKTTPRCLKKFLQFNRWPAVWQYKAEFDRGVKPPVLFAKFHGEQVRVVMASRFGDVGISRNLEKEHGYNMRVFVEELTDFTDSI